MNVSRKSCFTTLLTIACVKVTIVIVFISSKTPEHAYSLHIHEYTHTRNRKEQQQKINNKNKWNNYVNTNEPCRYYIDYIFYLTQQL